MLISIIIPVYNTPYKTFDRCIQSVLNQTYHELEIIVIDDGSIEDNSKLYERKCKEDYRISYYKVKNGGVSSARNFGIELASGCYIAFVDSDDIIREDFVEHAAFYGREENADMVVGLIKYISNSKTNRSFPIQQIKNRITITDKKLMVKCFFSIEHKKEDYIALASPCGRLFKTSILKSIRFKERIHYWEDQIFNREIIVCCQKIILIPEEWYNYIQNDYSAMHKTKFNNWSEIYEWPKFCEYWIMLNNKECQKDLKIQFSKMIITFFNQAMQAGILSGLELNIKELKSILQGKCFQDFFDFLHFKDFETFQRYIQFIMMKYKMILTIYFLFELKYLSKNNLIKR